jgi:hypothetical protein
MTNNCIFLCFLLLFSCSAKEAEYEILGVTDFKAVSAPMCVWLNGEPVFNLVSRSTFPRISNSYPIIKGDNVIKVKLMTEAQRPESALSLMHFFYANNFGEKAIDLTWSPKDLEFSGSFKAMQNYSIHDAGMRVQADEQTEEFAKTWTRKYLEAIQKKDIELLIPLFKADPRGTEWYEPVKLLLSKNAKCLSLLAKNEIIAYRGQSLVLVCSNDKLAEWKIGKTNNIFDNFLFCAFEKGVFLRVSGGQWVGLNQSWKK